MSTRLERELCNFEKSQTPEGMAELIAIRLNSGWKLVSVVFNTSYVAFFTTVQWDNR